MQNQKGWILLPDPFSEKRRFGSLASQIQKEFENTQTLIFDEDGRFLEECRTADGKEGRREDRKPPKGDGILPQLRAALQAMRGRCRQVGIAAEGSMCGAAASVAAQLPVDEILLFESRIFIPGERKTKAQRRLARIAGFARRNLPLVVADAVLVDCAPVELRQLLRFLVNGSVRIVHSGPEGVGNLWRKNESCGSGVRTVFQTPDVRPK